MQKCSKVSEEILWIIISKRCLPILLYGVDAVYLFYYMELISEEILWIIISKRCLPILLYGVDALSLHDDQVHKLSVALNLAIRPCFHLARNVSVRSLLYLVESMLMSAS